MGRSESKPADQHTTQRQSNCHQVIDQSTGAAWLQLNWESFGSGVSTFLIILILIVFAGERIGNQTGKPEEQNFMSSSPSQAAGHLTSAPPRLQHPQHIPGIQVASSANFRPISQGPSSLSQFQSMGALVCRLSDTATLHSPSLLDFPSLPAMTGRPGLRNSRPQPQSLGSRTPDQQKPSKLSNRNRFSIPPAPSVVPLVQHCPVQPPSAHSMSPSSLNPGQVSKSSWTNMKLNSIKPHNYSGRIFNMQLRY